MVGKYQIQLGAEQLLSGMSSSDFATDGALGTSSTNLNPFAVPGTMRIMASATNVSTNLSGNLIATSEDSQTVAAVTRVGIDDAGNIYSWDGLTTWTKQITGLSNAYSFPETDLVPYKGNNYATSTTKLMQINTSAWTKTENFQSLQDSSALHPELVYQQILWVGDGNHLASYDGSSWNADAAWVLDANEKIVALGIDPITGLMLVSVQNAYNPTDSFQQRGTVYMYDGVSAKPLRKIIVDDLITAFYNMGGTVYVGLGTLALGIWNGNGVTFLRKLLYATPFLKTELPYKHHFTNINNLLLVVDGLNVLGYGEPIAGKKAFFYMGSNGVNSNHIGIVTRSGSNHFGIGFASSKFYTFSLSDIVNTAQGVLYFNNIYMPRPVYVRRIRVITTGIGATTSSGDGQFGFYDEKGTLYSTQVQSFVNQTGSTKYVFDFDYSSAKVQSIQPKATVDTLNWGFVRFIIYYDIAE